MSGPGHPREADVPKQINTPRPGQALVRMFSLKGRFQPVLDETIVPVVQVPIDAPATQLLAAWGVIRAAAGAGNQNRAHFENLAASGSLVVITKFWAISGTANDQIHIKATNSSGSSTGQGRWRDLRNPQAPKARFLVGPSASIVLTPPLYPCDGTIIDTEWVVPPGWFLEFRQGAINATFECHWEWYEVDLSGGGTL
jgi:hypothetical protein